EICELPREHGPGHPPADTVRVLRTLRRFLREGTPWRSLTATAAQASGSTLRRWLTRWAQMGLLAQVHALLVGMLRGHPDLILDSCSVRAKRAGDLTGPNPTDRVSGCETSLALAITWRALGKTEGLLGGLWRGLTSSGAAERRSWTTLSGDRPFRT